MRLVCVVDLGMAALEREHERAARLAVESVNLAKALGDRYGATYALELVASLAAECDDEPAAVTLFAAVCETERRLDSP